MFTPWTGYACACVYVSLVVCSLVLCSLVVCSSVLCSLVVCNSVVWQRRDIWQQGQKINCRKCRWGETSLSFMSEHWGSRQYEAQQIKKTLGVTLHLTQVNKPREFFQRKLGEYRMQANHFEKVTSADELFRLLDSYLTEHGRVVWLSAQMMGDHGSENESRRWSRGSLQMCNGHTVSYTEKR